MCPLATPTSPRAVTRGCAKCFISVGISVFVFPRACLGGCWQCPCRGVPCAWGGCKVCSQLLHPQLNLHVAPRCLFAASSGDASIFGVVAPKNTSSGSWGSWLCITEELIKLGETQALEQGLFHVAENVVSLVLFHFCSNPCSSCTAWARSRGLSFLCGKGRFVPGCLGINVLGFFCAAVSPQT